MVTIVDKLLDPAVLALCIPVLAVLLWGLAAVLHAIRGEPEELEDLKTELQELRSRVDLLEKGKSRL